MVCLCLFYYGANQERHFAERRGLHTDTLDVLREEIATIARVREVGADTSITQDLGLDSLAVMNFVMALEDPFDVSIPLNRIVHLHTVAYLAPVFDNLMHARSAHCSSSLHTKPFARPTITYGRHAQTHYRYSSNHTLRHNYKK